MLDGLREAAESVAHWLAGLGDIVLAAADSPWSLVLLFGFTVIDGVFPPIPSETVVIALASLSITGEGPPIWAILPVAALAAFVGDMLAYTIGRRVPLRRMRWFRSEHGARTLAWAERALRERGGAFILSARYIPIGRVAVNMSAGALGFGRKRFMGFAAIAAVCWAIYSTLLGVGAGAILKDRPFLAVAVGVVLGVVLGTVIDVVVRRVLGVPMAAPEMGSTEAPKPEVDPVPDPEVAAGSRGTGGRTRKVARRPVADLR